MVSKKYFVLSVKKTHFYLENKILASIFVPENLFYLH